MEHSIKEEPLQILEFKGQGFAALLSSNGWRVGILRFSEGEEGGRIARMERHLETDEVFVLTKGRAILLLGGSAPEVEVANPHLMDPGKIYNVRRLAWHAAILSRDASILIVESDNTGSHNSEYAMLSAEMQNRISAAARREGFPSLGSSG